MNKQEALNIKDEILRKEGSIRIGNVVTVDRVVLIRDMLNIIDRYTEGNVEVLDMQDIQVSKEFEKEVNAVLDKILDEINEYKSRKIFGVGVADLEKGKETALDYVVAIIESIRQEIMKCS